MAILFVYTFSQITYSVYTSVRVLKTEPNTHIESVPSNGGIVAAYATNKMETTGKDAGSSSQALPSHYVTHIDSNEDGPTSIPEFVYLNNESGLIIGGRTSFWNDSHKSCQASFNCVADFTTGWKDNSSLKISTTPITGNNSWSQIYGAEISDIKPGENYSLITHMRENENVVQSHIALEGFNQTSQTWYQLTHCPTGTDGPLNWTRFSCEIFIPKDTSKVRIVLNAGWSSSSNHNAVTWYDGIYLRSSSDSPFLNDLNLDVDVINDELLSPVSTTIPEFVYLNNESGLIIGGRTSFWNDSHKSCQASFNCVADFTTGWKDNSSLKISTTPITGNNSWSQIYGAEISDIKPGENYSLITHMRENENVVQSHIALEGFNQTSQTWYQLTHCPTGTDGPLNWTRFSCEIFIPKDTSKVRIVLNAGWSSSSNHNAVTWYDGIYLRSSSDSPFLNDLNLDVDVINDELPSPVSMTFLGKDDYLVLQRENGTVERIVNGTKLERPLLDLNVSSTAGALGIAAYKTRSISPASLLRLT